MADENRIKAFKNKGKDTEVSETPTCCTLFYPRFFLIKEMRRRRIGQAVELRKAKKEDQLLKRRNISNDVEEPTSPLQENNSTSPTTMSAEEILYGKKPLCIVIFVTIVFGLSIWP